MVIKDDSNFRHFHQETNYSCGAAAARQLLHFVGINKDEPTIRNLVKTTKSGTATCAVFDFLRKNLPTKEIAILDVYADFESQIRWLNNLSKTNIIYCSGDFVCGHKRRGRPSERLHAFCIFQSKIYDPGEQTVFPIDCFGHTYDKKLKINHLILVHTGGYLT